MIGFDPRWVADLALARVLPPRPKGPPVNLRTPFLLLALFAATIAASPAPKPPVPPVAPAVAATQAPQDAALGFDVTFGNMLQSSANGTCHMTFVLPLGMMLGSRPMVWACVR